MSRAKTAVDEPAETDAAATDAVSANTVEGDAAAASPADHADHADHAAEPEAAETDQAEAEAEAGPEADQAEAEPEAGPGPDQAEAAEAAPTEADSPTEAEPARPRPAWRRLPVLLLAAAVVLTGAGVWFTLEARAAANTPAAANLALTDVAATADVSSAVSLAVNRIFSYSYDRTDVTEKAAAAVLRGSAKDSYDKLFAEVRRKAPEQKLVLTSRVSAIAVQELKNGHARLLVFLDQSAVRADNNATDSAAAQLSVTAEHTTGGWVITELEAR
jgi:Mce-associated membrane protein